MTGEVRVKASSGFTNTQLVRACSAEGEEATDKLNGFVGLGGCGAAAAAGAAVPVGGGATTEGILIGTFA